MLQMPLLCLQWEVMGMCHLGAFMLITLSRPVANHLGSCGLESCIYLIHSITKVLAVANSITQAENSNRLVLQI